MENVIERFENSEVTKALRRFFASWIFPAVSASIILVLYYLNLDLVSYWYICICGVAILVTCKDVTPFLFLILFLNLPISYKHSPSIFTPVYSDYYFRTKNVAQLVAIGSILVALIIVRIITSIINHRFKFTPMFWGLCSVALAFIFNGLFSNSYSMLNFMYGCALAAIYLAIFMFGCGNVVMDKDTLKKIAYYLIILFVVITIELIVGYYICEGFVVNGKVVNRSKLFFGWGTYNNMGMLIVLTIPAWFYFAGKEKHGWLFLLGGALNLFIAYMSTSRQAMLMGSVLFVACCVWNVIAVKGKKRRLHLVVIGLFAALSVALVVIMREPILAFIEAISEGTETGSGRLPLWKEGIYNNFLRKPIFGTGFYGGDIAEWDAGGSGLDKIPRFYHDTVVQLFASCGIVGVVAFAVHRTQTVISLFKNLHYERIFLALTMCGVMLCGLLDVHMFSPFSSLVYTILVPLLALSETLPKEVAEEAAPQEENYKRPKRIYADAGGGQARGIKQQTTIYLSEEIMEERNLTIKDIFILIGKHIKSILVVTLAVTIAAVAFVAFKYNKGKQHYTLTYQLSYPGSGNMLYPDSSAVIVTDSITKENLYRVKDSSSSFNSISIDDLATGGALSLSTEIVTLSDSEYERVFKLDVDAKYFSNAEQADKFLKEVAYYPIAHIIEIVGDDKYGQELEKFKNAKTYEEKIVSLNAQKKYLSNEYNKIADMGGSRVSENLAALSLVFTEAQQERLERQIEAYYYKLDTDEAISYANAQKIILQRKYDYNQSKIEETRQKRTDMINSGGGSSISAISSYDDIIASLTIENSDIRDELDEIENLLSAIEEYTVEGTPEYVAKQALDEELNGYFEAIEEETEKLRTTIVGIYTNNSRVVFSGNVSKEGGISLTLAALVGIVGGFVVAAIAICIIFSDSYKAEKYGEVVPANNAGEKEPQIIQPEDEEKLITVSELIGEAPPVLIEESASENTEIAATEEVQDVATEVNVEKAEEEQPAAEEKKAPAKKPAAKKTTSGTAKKPAAKKTTSGTTKKTASTKSAAKTSQE